LITPWVVVKDVLLVGILVPELGCMPKATKLRKNKKSGKYIIAKT
jgi:hypothetical protein